MVDGGYFFAQCSTNRLVALAGRLLKRSSQQHQIMGQRQGTAQMIPAQNANGYTIKFPGDLSK